MQSLLRWMTSFGLREDREAIAQLENIGVKLHPAAGWRPGVVLIIAAVAVIAAALGGKLELIGAILGGGALAVSYVEWVLTRREGSMDKFYERLVLANNYRKAVNEPKGVAITDMDLYVFSELDNLEYVIERYRFGYMSPTLALRGVNTFQSRFHIAHFRERVTGFIDLNCGYSRHTCKVAERVGRTCRDPATQLEGGAGAKE